MSRHAVRKPARRGERAIERRFLLTQEEDREFEDFLHRLRQETSVAFTASHLVRAALKVAQVRKNKLAEVLGRPGMPSRPANGDEEATRRFETELARRLVTALVEA